MHWVRFAFEGTTRLGLRVDGGVRDLSRAAVPSEWPLQVRRALETGDMVSWIQAAVETHVNPEEIVASAPLIPWEQIRVLAPIPRPPKNIFCVGRNYADHAIEAARFSQQAEELPQDPIFFSKPHTAIIGPEEEICCDPELSRAIDYEGELAVVIGRGGIDIPPEEAEGHIFGYTILNDVTARDLQRRHRQYLKGKGLNTFAPMGPVISSREAVGDVRNLEIRTWVDGELRQHARLDQLIFDIPTLIHVMSRGMRLEPGDILATGTPAGVGAGFDPPKFLKDGSLVEIQVEPIGTLRNPFRSRPAS